MDLGLQGKVVLVTGGSKGIGLACAAAFAAEGARVAIASRDAAHLAAAAAKLHAAGHGVFTHAADLRRVGMGVKLASPHHLPGGSANAALV
jgi:NAD(P)-dependent dehydrogenase (short-subunit alcohol dehydrogenase family)